MDRSKRSICRANRMWAIHRGAIGGVLLLAVLAATTSADYTFEPASKTVIRTGPGTFTTWLDVYAQITGASPQIDNVAGYNICMTIDSPLELPRTPPRPLPTSYPPYQPVYTDPTLYYSQTFAQKPLSLQDILYTGGDLLGSTTGTIVNDSGLMSIPITIPASVQSGTYNVTLDWIFISDPLGNDITPLSYSSPVGQITIVPEPSSFALGTVAIAAVLAIAGYRRFSKHAR
jgi:hypothetical protein